VRGGGIRFADHAQSCSCNFGTRRQRPTWNVTAKSMLGNCSCE
jgi:hypothetical protein